MQDAISFTIRDRIRIHAGQPAFGYPGYASAAGVFFVGRQTA